MEKDDFEGDKKEKNEEKKKSRIKSYTDICRNNPWVVSTLVLGILSVILIVGNFDGGLTGNVVSEKEASEAMLNFAIQQGADAELGEVADAGYFYEVTLIIDDNEVPLLVTKDGEYFLSGNLIPLAISEQDSEQDTEVPKSDIPEVELFIWGYCPYGVQAQGPLAEVASLLENYADFKAVLYYDGHGAFETQENKIQECIQKIAPEKYWDYAAGFVENIYPECSSSRDVDCDKTEAVKLMNSLGIDSSAVLNCVNTEGDTLFEEASDRAKDLGVTGSPTLVINGVKVSVSRNAESFKDAICNAFNDVPEECSTSLSSSTTTASGSC